MDDKVTPNPSQEIETVQDEAASKTFDLSKSNTLAIVESTDYRELLPKPSIDPNDPLNWTWGQKHLVLLIVGCMAFQGPFDAGSPTSSFYPQAAAYGVSVPEMLDVIGPFGVGLGIGALIWAPLANMYGRTPIYLAAAVVACLGALGCALAKDIGPYIGARVICALGGSASMSLGSSTVRDMFFVHERGQKMGIWTIFIGVSPYIAIILDGFVTTYAGWRWMQWLTFFIWAALLIVCATMLPETLYHRDYNLEVAPPKETYFHSLKWKYMGTKFRLQPFARPFIMLKFPSVLLPVFWYGNLYGFCVFGGLGILPFAFTEIYGFSPIGLGLVGIPMLVGTVLGEPMAGPFSDWIVRYMARRNDGIRHPEQRLHALWLGAVLVPIGLIMFGGMLQYEVHWSGPCVALGIFSFALQIINTVITTYPVDCYDNRSAEVGTIVNLGRQVFSFYVTFYLHQFTVAVGYAWTYGIFAILSVVLFLPIVALMVWGGRIRHKLGQPGPKE